MGQINGATLAAIIGLTISCGVDAKGDSSACTPGMSVACVGEAGCAGFQICADNAERYLPCACGGAAETTDATPEETPEATTVPGDETTSGGTGSLGNSGDSGGVEETGADGTLWQDPTLTTDEEARARADAYEEQIWPYRADLEFQLMDQFGRGRLSDDAAQAAGYSSGWGLATYHTMDELIELTQLMEITRDESHRLFYAGLARAMLEITIPAITEAEGTENCTGQPTERWLCSPGNFRYLDAGHGTGAAGFVMNALFENPKLRDIYTDDLERWATALVPILDRHAEWTESVDPMGAPHMPAKIGAGYLAVGKILDRPDYLQGFETIVRVLGASAGANSPAGWVGSDVSHARITMVVAHLAFREQLRGTLPEVITPQFLLDQGDVFEAARLQRPYPECFDGSLVGHHGVLLRFSSTFAELLDATYSLDSVSPGSHAWGCVAETIAALAMGHATALSPVDGG